MPGEPELELGDVPAASADGQRRAPELGPPEPSERVTRARADDAVRLEPRALLERDQRLLGLRAAPAVDGAEVRAGGPQRDLERGDVGAAGGPRPAGGREQATRTDRAHRCSDNRIDFLFRHPGLMT